VKFFRKPQATGYGLQAAGCGLREAIRIWGALVRRTECFGVRIA